ncbi:MAG: class I SAM-dependent methyltransferase [Acidimicrobiales bacterium]
MGERLDLVIRQSFIRYHEGVGALQREIGEISQRLERALTESERSSQDTKRDLKEKVRIIELGLADVRYRVGQVDLFLNEVKRSLPEPPVPERLAELPGALANLYPSFEEVMRGSEVVVKERARAYLDDIVEIDRKGPVLDLGCGRGEWLELLRDAGIDAYGVDVNEQYVEEGLTKGLDTRHADALEHLKGLPEFGLSAVTAIHLVEHLDIETLLEVLDLSLRALQPGGLLILETPNPENLIVGASSFYLDPTHVHPLPPLLLSFLVNARGFNDVVVRELKREEPIDPEIPPEAPWAEDVAKVWNFLQERVNGPEDYAVLARRA